MPAILNAELRGAREAQKDMERIVKELGGGPMLDATRDATLIVQREARQKAPVDRGLLRASIVPEVRATTTGVEGVVGSNLQYAAAVELGSRPHWPPIDAIAGWVHRTMRGVENERSVAFLIARKISRVGTKKQPYLIPAVEMNLSRIKSLFENAVKKVIRGN